MIASAPTDLNPSPEVTAAPAAIALPVVFRNCRRSISGWLSLISLNPGVEEGGLEQRHMSRRWQLWGGISPRVDGIQHQAFGGEARGRALLHLAMASYLMMSVPVAVTVTATT